MAVCPVCKTTQVKRVKGGCPKCGAPIQLYKGQWFRGDMDSPVAAIIDHFEQLVSAQFSKGRATRVPFSISRKTDRYPRECLAANKLLQVTEWDLDLVLDTLNMLFTHEKFAWKTRSSLMFLENDFTLAMAMVQASKLAEELAVVKNKSVLSTAMAMEDIFS